MDYLDRVFQDMMLVFKARMGDSNSWAPLSQNMNSCDLFWGSYLKEWANNL
jgi:hypothetical protein